LTMQKGVEKKKKEERNRQNWQQPTHAKFHAVAFNL
jgi:hypothetical protein